MNPRTLRPVLFGMALLFWVALIMRVALSSEPSQWDVEVYYYSAKAFSLGLNPYDPSNVCAVAGKWEPECLYLPYYPLSVFLLKPFALLSFEQAKLVFFLLKCTAFFYLLFLWQVKFMDGSPDPVFLVFCLLGFNAALFLDWRSGNVSLLEQALIWTGFLAFVRGKITLFCAFIGLAAIFKLTPLLFGGLLLLHQGPINKRPIFIMIAGFLVASSIVLSIPRFLFGVSCEFIVSGQG
ncbi:MAG: glycosyltransferase family 87 protein [Desulfomonilaceae bacterium]